MNKSIATEVLQREPARFDMVGKLLSCQLLSTGQEISAGLATRLFRYAERQLEENGFLGAVRDWSVTVGTNDGDEEPANRFYWVTWTNEKGGSISLSGILTNKGWPTLDHGLSIQGA
jgi:hypothetical protein